MKTPETARNSTTATDPVHWGCRRTGLYIDPDASSYELLDKAREWIRNADGIIGLVADLTAEVPDPDVSEFQQIAVALRAVYAMTNISLQFAEEAQQKRCQERLLERFDEPLS
jgi:hypothetical protein